MKPERLGAVHTGIVRKNKIYRFKSSRNSALLSENNKKALDVLCN